MIGIYTPIHKINYEHLDFLVMSLKAQTNKHFKWCICLNGDLTYDFKIEKELQNRYNLDILFCRDPAIGLIGSFKHRAVSFLIDAGAHVALELDYDDAIHPETIQILSDLYHNSEEKKLFFYSNFAHFDKNEATMSATYSAYYGWKTKPHKSIYFDIILNEMISFPPEDIYFARIESAPNHLRAFSKEMYEYLNGYNTELEVADDHEIMIRMKTDPNINKNNIIRIDKCLYYQRYEQSSTTFSKNDLIQRLVQANQNKYQNQLFNGNLNKISVSVNTEEELLNLIKEKHESLFNVLNAGGVLCIEIDKDINIKETIIFMKSVNFQYHSWTETKNNYYIYFTPFKDWYIDSYWGEPNN